MGPPSSFLREYSHYIEYPENRNNSLENIAFKRTICSSPAGSLVQALEANAGCCAYTGQCIPSVKVLCLVLFAGDDFRRLPNTMITFNNAEIHSLQSTSYILLWHSQSEGINVQIQAHSPTASLNIKAYMTLTN
jgi:hypothetical protein